VSFGYEPGRPVLRHISFTAEPGEVVAIVGPSGAGKTSLVNLLPRFLDPTSGSIEIDGHDIRDLTLDSLRRQIGMVMQDPYLMPLSIEENIGYGRPAATLAEIHAAATNASANGFIEQLPDMYGTVIGERGIGLSGGERQRISIARAFLRDAPILILDEPTSALDARTEAALLDALGRLMRERTTIVIAHRLSTIRNADRIIVLEDVRIAEMGRTPSDPPEWSVCRLYFHKCEPRSSIRLPRPSQFRRSRVECVSLSPDWRHLSAWRSLLGLPAIRSGFCRSRP